MCIKTVILIMDLSYMIRSENNIFFKSYLAQNAKYPLI